MKRDLIVNNYPEKMIIKYYNNQRKKLRMIESGDRAISKESKEFTVNKTFVSLYIRLHQRTRVNIKEKMKFKNYL